MKYLVVLLAAITALIGCGSDSNSSDQIHTTASYVPTTDSATLNDEHVVLITEENDSNNLLLLDSLSGETRELSLSTHDAYKIPQALISADRKQVLYIANQDSESRNDLYVAELGLTTAQRLTDFPTSESVIAIESPRKMMKSSFTQKRRTMIWITFIC